MNKPYFTPYFTVLEKLPENRYWGIAFGSYSKAEAKQEIRDLSEYAHTLTKFRIIETGDMQTQINSAVVTINEKEN